MDKVSENSTYHKRGRELTLPTIVVHTSDMSKTASLSFFPSPQMKSSSMEGNNSHFSWHLSRDRRQDLCDRKR